jgi:hypothetical protein
MVQSEVWFYQFMQPYVGIRDAAEQAHDRRAGNAATARQGHRQLHRYPPQGLYPARRAGVDQRPREQRGVLVEAGSDGTEPVALNPPNALQREQPEDY